MLAGCGLYCVLSSEQVRVEDQDLLRVQTEATARAPCHPPARFSQEQPWEVMGLVHLLRRKKTHCSGVKHAPLLPRRYGHVLILRAQDVTYLEMASLPT